MRFTSQLITEGQYSVGFACFFLGSILGVLFRCDGTGKLGEDIYYETGIDKHITQSERALRPGLELPIDAAQKKHAQIHPNSENMPLELPLLLDVAPYGFDCGGR